MNRTSQDTLLLLFGLLMLRVGVTDQHLRFVKAEMQPLIVAAAVVLVALGATGLVAALRTSSRAARAGEVQHDATGHGHAGHTGHTVPRTAWLLALPLFVLSLVAPPALGADAVERSAPATLAPEEGLPSLPAAVDGAVDLAISDYSQRALFAPTTVEGQRIRLVGFAVPDEQGWLLARLTLSCCAADGRPSTTRMAGGASGPVPTADEWFEVVGRPAPPEPGEGGESTPVLEVLEVTPVPAPSSPYETR